MSEQKHLHTVTMTARDGKQYKITKKAGIDMVAWISDITKGLRHMWVEYTKEPEDKVYDFFLKITCSLDKHAEITMIMEFNPSQIMRDSQKSDQQRSKQEVFGTYFKGVAIGIAHLMYPNLPGPQLKPYRRGKWN